MVAMATMERLFFLVMWLLCSSFSEACMNFGHEVKRSFHPFPRFSANFYHTPSTSFIIPPLTAPSHSLSASHITLSPSVPFPPSSVLLPLPVHTSLISHSLTYFAIHLFLSLLGLSVSFGFPLSRIPLSVSIAFSCLLTSCKGCALNSCGVALGGGMGLSKSW